MVTPTVTPTVVKSDDVNGTGNGTDGSARMDSADDVNGTGNGTDGSARVGSADDANGIDGTSLRALLLRNRIPPVIFVVIGHRQMVMVGGERRVGISTHSPEATAVQPVL